ncbi:odorant receptor 131-2-like [Scophthalmus maximus]|uniref:odorant receptor 131-2-like n=1 Tax=Scophthalmus maximus TaxID=52904 RepID=UPI0015E0A82D|nr:odorant receptor 131-2-like [Scophthalmus maximus]
MNSTISNYNVSSLIDQYSLSSVVAKNVIAVALGLIINYINGTLINTFRKHQIFYMNPRYILFIHLVLNDMIQLTVTISLLVFFFVFHKINASFCCLLITFAVFTTFNTPLNLAVMAVECYIAICLPLRHAELCTNKRTYILIGWIWAMSAVSMLPDLFIILATEPARLFYSTIFCKRDNLFRHPISLKKRDVSQIILLISVWLTLFYTYFKIFFAAKAAKEVKSGKGDAKKARNTILLHGFQLQLCMLTYVTPIVKEALFYWFPKYDSHVDFVSYIIIEILPRFISPIVYGLRDKTFRQHLKNHLLCTVRTSVKPLTAAKLMLLC